MDTLKIQQNSSCNIQLKIKGKHEKCSLYYSLYLWSVKSNGLKDIQTLHHFSKLMNWSRLKWRMRSKLKIKAKYITVISVWEGLISRKEWNIPKIAFSHIWSINLGLTLWLSRSVDKKRLVSQKIKANPLQENRRASQQLRINQKLLSSRRQQFWHWWKLSWKRRI